MAVEVHHVNVALFWVDNVGNVIDKNDPNTKLDDIRRASSQEHRVMTNTAGAAATANSAGHPTVATYLEAEASDDFSLAYMDQYQIVTHKITGSNTGG